MPEGNSLTKAAGSPTSDEFAAARSVRRAANSVRRLHHHAVRTDNMEATRRFYEDVVGMPLVVCLREMMDLGDGNGTPFLHCFFEMADGGCLAFFEFPLEAYGPAINLPPDGIDHHIAMSMPDIADVARLKTAFDELGIANCGIDHGFCYSLYARDPNGMLIEFVADPANEMEQFEGAVLHAHDELAKWNRGERKPNHVQPKARVFPLPTSPAPEIVKVLRGGRPGTPGGAH